MAKVHVIHENSVWVEPLRRAFDELKTPTRNGSSTRAFSTSAPRRLPWCFTTA
jgi:hypothetical protein